MISGGSFLDSIKVIILLR